MQRGSFCCSNIFCILLISLLMPFAGLYIDFMLPVAEPYIRMLGLYLSLEWKRTCFCDVFAIMVLDFYVIFLI